MGENILAQGKLEVDVKRRFTTFPFLKKYLWLLFYTDRSQWEGIILEDKSQDYHALFSSANWVAISVKHFYSLHHLFI